MVQQAYMLYGLCPCIFQEVQDSQKILIFENEALQKSLRESSFMLIEYGTFPPRALLKPPWLTINVPDK